MVNTLLQHVAMLVMYLGTGHSVYAYADQITGLNALPTEEHDYAKHIFVLYTKNTDPVENPNVDVFFNISNLIKSNYKTPSTVYLVRDVDDHALVDWKDGCPVSTTNGNPSDCLVCYDRPLPDRTCLMAPPVSSPDRVSATYKGDLSVFEDVERFIKVQSGAFLQDIFTDNESLRSKEVRTSLPEQLYTLSGDKSSSQCSEIDAASMDFTKFLHHHWLPQKPVVIKNVRNVSLLPLLHILSKYKDVTVGAKLSPEIEFEGVDSLLNWEMAGHQQVPAQVLRQMESPGLVVVRAAHEDMTIGRVMSLLKRSPTIHKQDRARKITKSKRNRWINHTSYGHTTNIYVEYMQLDSKELSSLRDDLLNITQDKTLKQPQQYVAYSNSDKNEGKDMEYPGFPSWVGALRGGTPYLWLGDGRAVGKLHFDPFDNLLLQLEGEKIFRLVDTSDNRRLYEGHMREAQLEARRSILSKRKDGDAYEFRKSRLLESTSMVHSPIKDLLKPDMKSYPRAENISFVDCRVEAGDMIFVPSFWWHEVKSSPGPVRKAVGDMDITADTVDDGIGNCEEGGDDSNVSAPSCVQLNIAVNLWFDPLYLKEFPCASCKKYVNKRYGGMLLDHVDKPYTVRW